MTSTMRVLVVDDEPLAREGLARMVARVPGCDVVGSCANAGAAVDACVRLRPDVLLLDVEMPGEDGFAVLRALPVDERPYTLLVTAFQEYALPAFGHDVRDYVLKPVDTRRLVAALDRAARAVSERRLAVLGGYVRSLSSTEPAVSVAKDAKLLVRDAGRMRLVPLERIDWIQADGYHARVHAGDKTYLVRESLDSLADRLPRQWIRAHRSSIVNLARITELRARRDGVVVAMLEGGVEIEVSRRRAPALRAALRAGAARFLTTTK